MASEQQLSAELVHAWGGLDQGHPALSTLDDIVTLKRQAPFPHHGRTAWLPLDEPITIADPAGGSLEIGALKIKGCGLYDQSGTFRPPSNEPYIRSSRHNAIKSDGSLGIVYASPAPLGGIAFSRALAEYEASRALFESGVSCQIPIRLYRYREPALDFQVKEGVVEPLAVVVTGQLSKTYLRGDIVERIDDAEEVARSGYRVPAAAGPESHAQTATRVLEAIYCQYGAMLRRFSEVGLYRHNGHVVNLGVVPETGRIYFTDLDSSRFLEECADIQRSWQVLRDSVSGLYQILFTVAEPRNRRLFPVDLVLSSNIIEAYLGSYYHDLPARRVEELSAPLHDYFRYLYEVIEEEPPPQDGDYSAFVKSMWRTVKTMPFEEAHAWLFGVCRVLHHESSISARYPLVISTAQFYQNLSDYVGAALAATIEDRLRPMLRE